MSVTMDQVANTIDALSSTLAESCGVSEDLAGLNNDIKYMHINGNPHVLVTELYDSGAIKVKYTHINGVFDGVWTFFWESGVKHIEYTYVNGRRHGPGTMWNKLGSIVEECVYVNGRMLELYEIDTVTIETLCSNIVWTSIK